MTKIIGIDGKKRDTSYEKQYAQSSLPGIGMGFTALRDRDTGEIFVPSVYYNTADGSSTMYWDSEKNEIFNVGTWTLSNSVERAVKPAFRTRFRKELDKYEIVAFSMKGNKSLPYISGHVGNLYNAGPCPLDRTMMSNIKDIVVLCKTVGVPDDKSKITTNESIEMLEVKEV